MTLSKNAETGISLAIPEISSEVSLLIPTYTDLYRVIPKRDPGISHYKNLILAYPKTSFLSRLIPRYPGIGHMSDYPGISRCKSGYGRVSLFQMELIGALRASSWRACDSFHYTFRSQCTSSPSPARLLFIGSSGCQVTCCN